MGKIKVLISGADGDVSQGIIKSLNESSLDIVVYKACISEKSSWLYKDDNSYIVPFSNHQDYISTLIKIINKNNIEVFIPAVDGEISLIAQKKSAPIFYG